MEAVRTWLISTMMTATTARTPMNAICGMTKVLKDSHMSSEQRECVQIISSSAKALLSLLNNILDFSKIEAGKTEIDVPVSSLFVSCITHSFLVAAKTSPVLHRTTPRSTFEPAFRTSWASWPTTLAANTIGSLCPRSPTLGTVPGSTPNQLLSAEKERY
jgi:hypothetical protein